MLYVLYHKKKKNLATSMLEQYKYLQPSFRFNTTLNRRRGDNLKRIISKDEKLT